MFKTIVTLFLVTSAALAAHGVYRAFEQHHRIKAYVPVEARVLSSHVRSSGGFRGRASSAYLPVVIYAYDVGGQRFETQDVFPIERTGQARWAAAVAARYPVGATPTAYRDPAAPGRAFLVREHGFEPYCQILFATTVLTFAVGLALSPRLVIAVPSSSPTFDPYVELHRLRQQQRLWGTLSAMWLGLGGLALGHCFAVARIAPEGLAAWAAGLYALPALLFLGLIVHCWLRRKRLFRGGEASAGGRRT